MNKRARYARRILRDHRRNPGSHTRWNRRPYGLEGRTLWVCPRCPKRPDWVAETDLWHTYADATVSGPLVDGQWRLEAMAKDGDD